MKKLLVLVLALVTVFCLSANAAAGLPVGLEITPTPEDYQYTDLSEHKVVKMYLVGDGPDTYCDVPEIFELINERLAAYNTEIDVTFISWSDAGTMYPLILAGGEKADLIFVATWRNLWSGAADESFYKMDMEFIEKYMPYTFQYQPKESFMSVTYNGDIIAITQNHTPSNPALIAYRSDLADQFGFEGEITNWDEYKTYLKLVAEHTAENGIFAYNAGATDLFVENEATRLFDWGTVAGSSNYRFEYSKAAVPTVDDITYYYTSEQYNWMLHEAKELCDLGVWSRSALSKTETAAQSFQSGTGAVVEWNYTVFQYMTYLEETTLGVARESATKATILNFDLYGNQVEGFNNNAMSILACSEDPQRAAMVLDLCKFDTTINTWICKGVEGRHFVYNEDNAPVEGPEFADFKAGGISLCWGVQNNNFNQSFAREDYTYWYNKCCANSVVNNTYAFVLDNEPIAAEAAAIDATITEYRYTLGLGLVDDVDVALAEFIGMLDACGLETYDTEYRAQYSAWYDSLGL